MAEQIDIAACEETLRAAVAEATDPKVKGSANFLVWAARVSAFSELCKRLNVKSHIAVLGNAILAKATNPRVDVYTLKAGADSGGAFDARRSAEKVLVPGSQRYQFSIGVSGPQPLNNQPFFRAYRIDSQLPIRNHLQPVLENLLKLLHEIQQLRRQEAVTAFAAFIDVRRRYVVKYDAARGTLAVATAYEFASVIEAFVGERSEGGARAQTVVGGLMEALLSAHRVRVGKKNEPDTKVPGDIAVRTTQVSSEYQRVFEVRDKNVPEHAALAYIAKAADAKVSRAVLVAVAADQEPLDPASLAVIAHRSGVDLQLFRSWIELIDAVVFASEFSEIVTIEAATSAIRKGLIVMELPESTVARWDELTLVSQRDAAI